MQVSRLEVIAVARSSVIRVFLALLVATSSAQENTKSTVPPKSPSVNTQLPVNWLYGAYIPKDAPLVGLTGKERFKLYLRQTYTTPGIYIKTGFFVMHDQVKNTPPAWGMDSRVSPNALAPIRRRISSKTHSLRWDRGWLDGNRVTTAAGATEPGPASDTRSSETSSPITTVNNPSDPISCPLRRHSERE